MTTLFDLKKGANLPDEPIYVSEPYVVLSKDEVILSAGTLEQIKSLWDYYDDCKVDIRRYDLYLSDNTKINEETQNFAHVTVYDPEDFILRATKNRRDGKLHYEALVTQRNMLIHALHNLVIRCEMEDEQGRLVVKDDLLKIANKLIGRAAQ